MTLDTLLGPAVPAWPAIPFWRLLGGSWRVGAMLAFADVNGARL